MADVFPAIVEGRSASTQAGYQALGLAITLGIALLGGLLVGFILKLSVFGAPPDAMCFEDNIYWEVPGEEEGHEAQLTDVRPAEAQKLTA